MTFPKPVHLFRSLLRSIRRQSVGGRYRRRATLGRFDFQSLESRILPATIIVNSLLDNTVADDGFTTLREAINSANNNPDADTITFAPSLIADGSATILLSTIGDTTAGPSAFGITTPITIQGLKESNGVSIQRDASASNMRLFYVGTTGNLTIDSVTLSGGVAQGETPSSQGGGGAGLGGAVFNRGTLQISNSTLSSNRAVGGAGGPSTAGSAIGTGGGLGIPGVLAGSFGAGGPAGASGPSAAPGGAGGFGGGGGGGGVGLNLTGNGGPGGFGGGGGGGGTRLYTTNGGFGGTAGFGGGNGGDGGTLSGAGGGGAGMGGAIFNAAGTVSVLNSTLAENSATGGNGGNPDFQTPGGSGGGALGGAVFSLNGSLTILYSTIATNSVTAGTGGSPTVTAAGIYILAMDGTGIGAASGTSHSVANNIIASNTGSVNQFTSTGSLTLTLNGLSNYFATTSSLLGPLQWNGGPTKTIAISNDSQVVNVGSFSTLTTDQRGSTRPLGTSRDFGAFELGNSTPTDIALTPTSIIENAGANALVGTLSTTDADAGDTHTYSFFDAQLGDDDNSLFTISGDQLLAKNSFDYETRNSYKIRLRTNDANGLSYLKTFTISVTKENSAPAELYLSSLSVQENSLPGTVIGTFSAIDPDGGPFTYSLVAGDGDTDNGWFVVEGNQLKVSGALNYEVQKTYSVRVQVMDSQGATLEKSFSVNVQNVSEDPFVVTQDFSIGENSTDGAFIGTIVGGDEDDGDSVTFSITGGNTDDAFAIDPTTGVLSVSNSAALDWETVQKFDLTITVTGNGASAPTATAPVTVFLEDRNDAPVVTAANFTVAEKAAVDTVVGTVQVNDADVGQSRTYSIADGNRNNAFKIDPATGVIRVNSSAALDYEYIPEFSLVIRVVDNGNPALAGSAIIKVAVIDGNDSPVVFTKQFLINEMSAEGAFIGKVPGYDPDAGQTISYSIIGGNAGNAFAIDSATGILSVNNSAALDFETASQIDMTVQVTDNAATALSSTASVTVFLRDVNDAPVLNTAAGPRLTDWWRKSETNPGETVGNVIGSTDPAALITDQDAGALKGFAVINAANLKGTWEYSTNGGTTWASLAGVSASNARLLNETAKLRFVPFKKKFSGEVSLTVVAWDQTVGTNGGTVNASVRGGATAFSADSVQVTQSVVKQQPVI